MSDFQQTETVTIKACCRCSGGLLERDRFCRWCGARQTIAFRQSGELIAGEEDTLLYNSSNSPYTTSALAPADEQSASFRPVSGPLVQAMIAGMSAAEKAPHASRAFRAVMQVLVSIPIWMMIVLLSPFDAYASARTISRHY
jgi:hypothetical protein